MCIVINSPYDTPVEPLIKILGLPSANDMIYQENPSMAYKAVDNQAQIYLTTLFNRFSSVTNKSLCNSELDIRPSRLKQDKNKTALHTDLYAEIARKQIISTYLG